MAKKKVAKRKQDAATFEQSLERLEAIVARLEGGQLGLADALAEYEAGVGHLKSCYELLTAAERRVKLVSGLDAEGQPRTRPFDDDSGDSLDEKSAARGRRRSSSAGRDKVDDSSSLF